MTTLAMPARQIILPRFEFPAWVKRVGDPLRMLAPMGGAFMPMAVPVLSSFTPTQLSGLKLWYAPRTLSLNDADPISTNTDYSGNGWDATAVTTARPTFKTNIVNGLAIARYDGSANKMTVAAGAAVITNNVASCTIFSVVSTTTTANNRDYISINNNSTSARAAARINSGTGKWRMVERRLDGDAATNLDAGATFSTSTFYILVGIFSWTTNAFTGYQNGGSATISGAGLATGNTSATDSAAIYLGVSASGSTQFWSGDIGDQLVYVPALTLANLNLVGAYLGTTYNLSWTTAV